MAIICGTDFSEDSRRAGRVAAGLAAAAGDEVLLVHAMEMPTVAFVAGEGIVMPPATPAPDEEAIRAELDQKLAAEARSLGDRVRPVLSIGAPEEALVEEARRYRARLIVVGSHGARGPARWLLGSTADRLARSSPIPLVVVRRQAVGLLEWAESHRPMKVLVCVDFGEATNVIVDAALSLCHDAGCDLHFAHSFEQPTLPFTIRGPNHPATQWSELERLVIDELVRIARKTARDSTPPEPASSRIHLLRGKPAPAICELAAQERFDLIVMGTHERRGLNRLLLGSVAVGVLHRAPCPVVITPLPEETEHAHAPRRDPDEPPVPPPPE